MSPFAVYLAGYVVIVVGLAIAAYLLNVPASWVLVGTTLLIGIGILAAALKATPVEPAAPDEPPTDPPAAA